MPHTAINVNNYCILRNKWKSGRFRIFRNRVRITHRVPSGLLPTRHVIGNPGRLGKALLAATTGGEQTMWKKKLGIAPICVSPLEKLLTREFVHQNAKKMVVLNKSPLEMMEFLQRRTVNSVRPLLDSSGVDLRVRAEINNFGYGIDLSYRWNQRVQRFATEYPKRDPKCGLALRLMYWDACWKVCGEAIEID